MLQQSHSFGQQVWQRLKKRKAAFISLLVIFFAVLVAIFGYVIAPDNTPFADLQTVEIQARKPSYQQLFLKIPNNKLPEGNAISHFFNGKPSAYNYLPISSYAIRGNEIVVQKYVDEDTAVEQRYDINAMTKNNPANIQNNIVTKKYRLGTDAFGRDILSRIIIGTRVSLAVGWIAVIISLLIGTLLGAVAGYYRGWVDEVIMWLVNVTWSIPTFFWCLLLPWPWARVSGRYSLP